MKPVILFINDNSKVKRRSKAKIIFLNLSIFNGRVFYKGLKETLLYSISKYIYVFPLPIPYLTKARCSVPKRHQTIEKVVRSDFRRGGICNFSALKAEEERSVVNCHGSDIDACVCRSRCVGRDKKSTLS